VLEPLAEDGTLADPELEAEAEADDPEEPEPEPLPFKDPKWASNSSSSKLP